MNKKVISAGHICLDITPIFPAENTYSKITDVIEPGKLINVGSADIHTGGSVANTGLALKKLGVDVKLFGKIGADSFGETIKQISAGYGASGLLVDDNSSTSYSAVIAVPGIDRVFLHHPGANNTFLNSDIPDSELEDAVLFHFGYPPLMRSMYINDGAELKSIFKRMKDKGIATSLDMAAIDPNSEAGKVDWVTILKNVLPYVDFFVPSFEELCFILNRPLYNELAATGNDMTDRLDIEGLVAPLADKLLDLGCKTVLIKCGISGMYYKTASADVIKDIGSRLELNVDNWSGKSGIQPCFVADQVLSGTGAGDTSIAAYLTAVLSGYTPEESVELAAAEGACAVTTYDALSGLKTLDELKKKINSGWKRM